MPPKLTIPEPNPSGLCMCGCGMPAAIAKQGNSAKGIVGGAPSRYAFGHQSRKSPVEYIVEDRGYETPCWIWQRAVTGAGYGNARSNGHNMMAHRFVYIRERGDIPEGLTLDHLCRVPRCVNPDHMDPVPQKINNDRSMHPTIVNRRNGVCAHGHPRTEEHGYINARGHWLCSTCHRRRYQEFLDRKATR